MHVTVHMIPSIHWKCPPPQLYSQIHCLCFVYYKKERLTFFFFASAILHFLLQENSKSWSSLVIAIATSYIAWKTSVVKFGNAILTPLLYKSSITVTIIYSHLLCTQLVHGTQVFQHVILLHCWKEYNRTFWCSWHDSYNNYPTNTTSSTPTTIGGSTATHGSPTATNGGPKASDGRSDFSSCTCPRQLYTSSFSSEYSQICTSIPLPTCWKIIGQGLEHLPQPILRQSTRWLRFSS